LGGFEVAGCVGSEKKNFRTTSPERLLLNGNITSLTWELLLFTLDFETRSLHIGAEVASHN
jgi:hypothetical protein